MNEQSKPPMTFSEAVEALRAHFGADADFSIELSFRNSKRLCDRHVSFRIYCYDLDYKDQERLSRRGPYDQRSLREVVEFAIALHKARPVPDIVQEGLTSANSFPTDERSRSKL
ncbi:MAG TPA: hypothetical protein VEH27_18105 [Methylomirabilota bacterium]|nr:hypothetical protein [Methylomirabilota bacterium]